MGKLAGKPASNDHAILAEIKSANKFLEGVNQQVGFIQNKVDNVENKLNALSFALNHSMDGFNSLHKILNEKKTWLKGLALGWMLTTLGIIMILLNTVSKGHY
jgi:hypothetical protein